MFCYICGEREICSTIKKPENIMSMIVTQGFNYHKSQ